MNDLSLSRVIEEPLVLPELRGTSMESVLGELVGSLASQRPDVDAGRLLASVCQRERLGSTGIVEGVAIPHGRLPGLSSVALVIGRHAAGVNFGAIDGMPTRLFFLLASPEESNGSHLKLLARVSRLVKDAAFRDSLMQARDQHELYRRLVERDAA